VSSALLVAQSGVLCDKMKKLARRQNEDTQQTSSKDKKTSTASAASKNNGKRSSRDDDVQRQLTFTYVPCLYRGLPISTQNSPFLRVFSPV